MRRPATVLAAVVLAAAVAGCGPTTPAPGIHLTAALNDRGLARVAKKEYEAGIKDYDEALRINPKNTVTYANRAVARKATRQYGRAANSVFPTGPYFKVNFASYGNDVNFPIPITEKQNPNFSACLDRLP